MSPALAALFVPRVVAAEVDDAVDATLLDAAEAALCIEFAPKRIADFAAGRLCARKALEQLGIAGFALVVNADRTPRWPPGIVGSISHTTGYCCAVAAQQRDVRSIGIDAERVGRVTSDISRLIFTAREMALLASLNDVERTNAATIIFSAKEAFYKCQYPLTHRWLDFHDAWIDIATAVTGTGIFSIERTERTPDLGSNVRLPLAGRFRIEGGIAVTAVAIDHDSP